ncbi:MAG: hypothetical protein MZV63_60385 [Marinilabiliales bacterium]|nr:hypothetical protein [Marinilabiliales bacterium]
MGVPCITTHMAVGARRGDMSARQREYGGVVIETPFSITGRMALQTWNAGIRITSNPFMLLVGIRLVVIVTVDTGKYFIIRRICVAFRAIVPGSCVLTRVNGKRLVVVLFVFGGSPARSCGMTVGTGC